MKKMRVAFYCRRWLWQIWLVGWAYNIGITPATGQGFWGRLPEKQHKVDIPFEFSNNFILITLRFKGLFHLRFIYDTGSEFTILTKKSFADALKVPFEREFRLLGSDMSTELVAYLARRIEFETLDGSMQTTQDILVMQEDYFRFEEYAGVEVHGILAGSVFANFYIQINYQKKVITLIQRDYFKLPSTGFDTLALESIGSKLYLNTELELQQGVVVPVKLLLDTGAGLSVLLFTHSHPEVKPPPGAIPGNIGMGLGGYLEGFHGRIWRLKIGKFEQTNVISEFQQLADSVSTEHLKGRNGILGNGLLNRFTVILDFYGDQMYLRPNSRYWKSYEFDRSGLSLITSGADLTQFTVHAVLPHSPAAEAGIRPGDRLLRVGFWPTAFFSLPELLKKFQKKEGTRLKVVLRRGKKKIRSTLVLRNLV